MDPILAEVHAVSRIPILPSLLNFICKTTGMRFAAVARVTEDRWITCQSLDKIDFGLKTGDELDVQTTICNEIRELNKAVVIDHVEKDEYFNCHPTPKLYGFQSYISVPIYRKNGEFFGTLCAIDPEPARVNNPDTLSLFEHFAELISFHLETLDELDEKSAELLEEKKIGKLREQFLAILGHDLRTPVSTIRLSTDLLLQLKLGDIPERNLKMIKSSTFRMENLIENILDFARGNLGDGIRLNKEENLQKLEKALTDVIQEIKVIAPERDIEVVNKFNKPVHCDAPRVAQLFSNLLSNAISHGDTNSPIKVQLSSDDNGFKLAVANGGKKIPETAKKHLFQPFYRESIDPENKGLGLGLYIASEIAKAHQGKLEVNSTDMETQFTFSIPV